MVSAKSRAIKEKPRVWMVLSTFVLVFILCVIMILKLLP